MERTWSWHVISNTARMDTGSDVGPTPRQGQTHCRTISPIRDRHRDIPFTKRRTDMPSEHKMLFFTPELYRHFNSLEDAIALAADAEWELAIAKYNEYLAAFREEMPSQVVELSELCLHDGEILQRQEQQHPLDSWCAEDGPG